MSDEPIPTSTNLLSKTKETEIPLINNTINELSRNISNLQISGDNSFNNSHKVLFYLWYRNSGEHEGRACSFNSHNFSIEEITKFRNLYWPFQVATTQNKIFGINSSNKSFEIYDLNTRQILRGSDLSEWREWASIAYFKDKLYYLSGNDPKAWIWRDTNRVDVLIDGKWKTGPALPLPIRWAQTITCNGILYVIDGWRSRKIYRLSDDEREWVEIEKISKKRYFFEVASLNGKIYITGGRDWRVLKSCLCFDPSAPVDSRVSQIADMNYTRYCHSLIVANEKLYAIGGFQHSLITIFCNSIEEYDPQTNKWREVGEINIA